MAESKKASSKPAGKAGAPIKHKDFVITQKKSGRYSITNAKGKQVNGEEKVKLLVEAKLLAHPSAKKQA